MNDFSTTEIAEKSAQRTIDKILDSIYSPAARRLSVARIKIAETLTSYLKFNIDRCARVKTIDQSSESRSIKEIFVDLRLAHKDREILSTSLLPKVHNGDRCILIGKGGSGKSVLIKHMFLEHIRAGLKKVPLLVEMRKFDSSRHKSLAALCEETLLLKDALPSGVFRTLCEDGFFNFFFDGFDELKRPDKVTVESELLDLARRFPNCGILVSGRNNSRFPAWEGFSTHSICDLDLAEIKMVINSSKYGAAARERLIAEIEHGPLARRREILSTPLLANLFIMTYANYGDIPKNLSGFYGRAFDTLAARHDATKESFKRDLCLAPDAWRILFGLFCLKSYLSSRLEFEDGQLREFLGAARKYAASLEIFEGVDRIPLEALCEDLWEGLNVLVKDYGSFHFLHRSFQEYFAAECVSRTINSKVREVLSAFARRESDSAFMMAFELNEERVTDTFIAPGLSELKEQLSFGDRGIPEKIFLLLGPTLEFASDNSSLPNYKEFRFSNETTLDFLRAASSICSSSKAFRDWESSVEHHCKAMVPNIPKNLMPKSGLNYEVTWGTEGLPSVQVFDAPEESEVVTRLQSSINDSYKKSFKKMSPNDPNLFHAIISRCEQVIRKREQRRSSIDRLIGL